MKNKITEIDCLISALKRMWLLRRVRASFDMYCSYEYVSLNENDYGLDRFIKKDKNTEWHVYDWKKACYQWIFNSVFNKILL